MPLSPPIDYSRVFIAIVIGTTIGLALFALTRSTLPHVGDNLHSLPHGGRYRDGTKSIDYCGPRKTFPSSSLFGYSGSNLPALAVFLLVAVIIAISSRQQTTTRACNCQ
ncbi:triple gene block protein 2 [Aconite virus A]|uniref:Movement protein TGB2 n=1 Tax=Aconite virus A TaxID=2764701 RepID=A0A8K0YXK4_9VIRU|nr:triple gene block protein 2 [Aconite virus A]QNJ34489.1 triple gene block protein 2 [Aconite virus A]